MTIAFAGAVLAGGASRRMGRDKALVEAPDGRALVVVGVDALMAAGASEVVVVGGNERALRGLGVRWVPDLHPGEGPLGGILTALSATDSELVVVMACDMPGVGREVPVALVTALQASPGSGAAVAAVGDREQPLTACWRRSAAAAVLRAAFEAGERAPRMVLPALGAVRVDGLPVAQLVDVDSPEDLRRYAELPPLPDDTRTGRPVSDVPEIDITILEERLGEGVLVVDVREADEYTGGHVDGAVHIPLGTVPDRVTDLPSDAPVLVICHVGGRSARAVQFLRAQGLDATNVAGGTKAWIDSGRPVVTGVGPV